MNSESKKHTLDGIQTLQKRIDVMNAFLEGKPIQKQKRSSCEITECEDPAWYWETFEYSVKPTILPTIDWTAITPEWKWFAFNASDVPLLFNNKPEASKLLGLWALPHTSDKALPVPMLAGITRGNMPWHQTLIQRPDTVYGGN